MHAGLPRNRGLRVGRVARNNVGERRGHVEVTQRTPALGNIQIGFVAFAEIVADAEPEQRHRAGVGFVDQRTRQEWRSYGFADRDAFLLEPDRRHDVDFMRQAEHVFGEHRVVVRLALLIEARHAIACIAINVQVRERPLPPRVVAVEQHGAGGERVAVAPLLAHAQVHTLGAVLLALQRGAGGRRLRRQRAIGAAAVLGLVGRPQLADEQPAIAPFLLVSQHDLVAIHPVPVPRRRRGAWIGLPLWIAQATRIAGIGVDRVDVQPRILFVVGAVFDVQVGLAHLRLRVRTGAVAAHVAGVGAPSPLADAALHHVVGGIQAVAADHLFGAGRERRARRRPLGNQVQHRRGFRSVQQAGTAADQLDFRQALRQRHRVQGREADPVGFERDAVLQHQHVFRFLRIAEAAVAQVELGRRRLLRDHHARRACQQLLQVVVDHGGLRVEVRDRGLLGHGDPGAVDFRHLMLQFGLDVLAPVVGFLALDVDGRQGLRGLGAGVGARIVRGLRGGAAGGQCQCDRQGDRGVAWGRHRIFRRSFKDENDPRLPCGAP